jgi:hypothetical protein
MLPNLFEITKMVRLFYGRLGPINVEIPINKNTSRSIIVTDSITLAELKDRVYEVGGDYFGDVPTTKTSATSLNTIENNCSNYPPTNVLIGFAIGIALIILLLSINVIVMILKKRSKYRTRIENISGDSLRLDDLFPDFNHTQRQQQQQKKIILN